MITGLNRLTIALAFTLAACQFSAEPARPPEGSFRTATFVVRSSEASAHVNGAAVTAAFFNSSKVGPMLGRLFRDEEFRPAAARVVVIGYSLWQSKFGGDPAIIGRTVTLDEQPYTVVGVLPRSFRFPGDAEVWIPRLP